MATELAPWVKANLATSGTEQSWLIGFFKSGIGAQDLLLKHPDLFTLANFEANYRLTQALMTAREAPFTARSPSRRSPPTASTSTADGGF